MAFSKNEIKMYFSSETRKMVSQKVLQAVTPAKAGVQNLSVFLDSGFRRNDRKRRLLTFCEFIKKGC